MGKNYDAHSLHNPNLKTRVNRSLVFKTHLYLLFISMAMIKCNHEHSGKKILAYYLLSMVTRFLNKLYRVKGTYMNSAYLNASIRRPGAYLIFELPDRALNRGGGGGGAN